MAKTIPGFTPPKSKPLAPIYKYEVDIGKAKPLFLEANRIDQVGDALIFMIEYTEYNVCVAGFSKWKSYRIVQKNEVKEEPLKPVLKRTKASRSDKKG